MAPGDENASELAALQARLEAVGGIDRGIADALHLIPDDVTAFWRSRAQVAFTHRLSDLADHLVQARAVLDDAQSSMQRGIEAVTARG